jgi:hypothetical protein
MTISLQAFELEDFIVEDPFLPDILKKRDEESDFFYIHRDYSQYLQYLNIIWSRIRESYRTIGIYYYQEMDLLSKQTSKNLSENEKVKLNH